MNDFVEFPIEYQTEVPGLSDELRAEAEKRLLALTTNHQDMTGAAVVVDMTAASNTPSNYRVRIVVYMRQRNIVAVKEDDTAEGAMMAVLKAVERQVRETREKFNETWKRPDIEDQPPLTAGEEPGGE